MAEVVAQIPQVDVLFDALLELLAVEEDQLAGEDDEPFVGSAVEGSEPVVEQLGQLAGVGFGRLVVRFARGIEGDARFGGVGDHETDIGIFGQLQVFVELGVGVQPAADDVDQLDAVDLLALVDSLQVEVIEAVLGVEHVHHAPFDGLYDHYAAVESGLFVHVPHDPVHEGAEEVPFPELDDPFGIAFVGCVVSVQRLHNSLCLICQNSYMSE